MFYFFGGRYLYICMAMCKPSLTFRTLNLSVGSKGSSSQLWWRKTETTKYETTNQPWFKPMFTRICRTSTPHVLGVPPGPQVWYLILHWLFSCHSHIIILGSPMSPMCCCENSSRTYPFPHHPGASPSSFWMAKLLIKSSISPWLVKSHIPYRCRSYFKFPKCISKFLPLNCLLHYPALVQPASWSAPMKWIRRTI